MNRISDLFHKKIYLLWNRPEILLLTMVQDISFNSHLAPFSLNRQDACSTRKFTLCGTGILPVHKKLIDNGARYQF